MNKHTFFLITLAVVSCYHVSRGMEEENDIIPSEEVRQLLQESVKPDAYDVAIADSGYDDLNDSMHEWACKLIKGLKRKKNPQNKPNGSLRYFGLKESKERYDELPLLSSEKKEKIVELSRSLLPILILSSTAGTYIVESYDLEIETWETIIEVRLDAHPEGDRSLPWCGAWFKERGSFWKTLTL